MPFQNRLICLRMMGNFARRLLNLFERKNFFGNDIVDFRKFDVR